MEPITEKLSQIPAFENTPPARLSATRAYWLPLTLRPSQILWRQNDPATEIAIVLSGELSVTVDGVEVGKIQANELTGEVAAFFGGARSATVSASADAQVVKLTSSSLQRVRRETPDVYEALLNQSLLALVRRVRATDLRIARLTTGTVDAPVRTEPGVLARLWKSLRPGAPATPCPELASLLRKLPNLKACAPEVIEAIKAAFVPQPIEEGQIIFLEGEPGEAAYLLAEGQIDVLRHVRGAKAELLASLKPEALFGMNTLVERGARTASCVAGSSGWLFRMDAQAFRALKGEARLSWHEQTLTSLASQIRNANDVLHRIASDQTVKDPEREEQPRATSGKDDSFQELLKASGFLEAHAVKGASLSNVRVVTSEDQRRNNRSRQG